jgi:Spy/CpxP family protein refolding chaperone
MKRTVSTFVLSVLAAGTLAAQVPRPAPTPTPQPGQPDPFGRLLYPPELVMQHQGELGLTDAQRASIQKDAIAAQYKFIDMQWKMSAEMEKLTNLLSAAPIDEAQALEQLDRILSAERDVKKAQIGLLIRIKNTLTREQQEKLDRLRQAGSPRPANWKEPPESLPPG